MAKAALSMLERPAGAIPLSEYLNQRPRWKTFLAAKAECDRLMQPWDAHTKAEREAALAEFHADRQARKFRLFGRLGHSWEPYREIPSDTPVKFRLGTSTAVERVTNAEILNVCVIRTCDAEAGKLGSAGRHPALYTGTDRTVTGQVASLVEATAAAAVAGAVAQFHSEFGYHCK
jgi:hypothetical protein